MNALLRQKLVPASLIFCGTCCLAFLPFVFGGCFASPGQDQEFTDHAATPIALYDWEFHWGDAPVDARGIPVWTYEAMPADFWQPIRSVEVPEGHPPFAWIRIRLPEHLPGSAVVATDVIATSFEAYVDSVRIYRFGTLRPDPASKYALATAQVIPLPDGAAGRPLYLRVYSQYADFFGAHLPLFLATEGDILRMAFRKDLSQLIVGFIILTTGLISLLLLFKAADAQRAAMLLHLSIFALGLGIYYVGNCFFIALLLPAPVLWYYLYPSFYLFPVGMLGFLEQVAEVRFRRVIRRLWQVHLGYFAIGLVLYVVSLSLMPLWITLFFALLAVSLIASLVSVLPAIRGGNREARIFGVGLFLMVVPAFYDTVVLGFNIAPNNPFTSHWGVLIFLLFLGYLLAHRFSDNIRQLRVNASELEAQSAQLKAVNERLEEYSATLAQKVEERTLALREKNEELGEKNEELAETLERLHDTQQQLVLREKLASLGALTAGIAHEIKNPLNFVNNFAGLSRELVEELQQELAAHPEVRLADLRDVLDNLALSAEKIETHGQRADGIVRSMMAHARGGEGTRAHMDLNALVSEYVDLAYHGKRAQTPGFNVALERELAEEVGEVEVVAQDVGRVLLNLLANAFDAVYEKAAQADGLYVPEVRISTRRREDVVEIRIQDNGGGIAAGLREKVFEPFFTTKPPGTGTGLGLSLAYDIVTQGHGGSLTMKSEEGQGATFVVTLPATRNAPSGAHR